MSQYGEPPQHPAATYYPPPASAAPPPKDLTTFGVLAFSTATLATIFTVVDATVVGQAVEHADDEGDLHWSVAVDAIGSGLTVLALLAGWITASMWLLRARKNAELLSPGALFVRSSGWAWGGWVCPIVSLWFPFQVVRDTHRAVASYFSSALIGWWWTAYLFMTIGSRIKSSMERDATASDAGAIQGTAIFFAAATVVALVLWGLVLRRVTREQHDRLYGRTAG